MKVRNLMKEGFMKRYQLIQRFFFSVAVCISGCLTSLSGNAMNNSLPVNLITFNILAAPWANPDYFPPEAAPFLDRALRRTKVINFLLSQPLTDIIALQEVTAVEFGFINDVLMGNNYLGFMSFNSPCYWSNWITENPPWEPNGNAIFIKKSRFNNISFQDIVLSDDGNHAAYAEAIESITGRAIRVASIELDSENPYRRDKELNALFKFISVNHKKTDIIAGDFNTDVENSHLRNDILMACFTDILAELNITKWTTPYSTLHRPRAVIGTVDTVLVRYAIPVSGNVFDSDLYTTFPDLNVDDGRITKNLELMGSDHFPVGVSFTIGTKHI